TTTGSIQITGGEFAHTSGTISNTVTINGGLLTGIGTLAALTANSGEVAPGLSGIGTLSVPGTVFFNSGSTFTVELNPAGQADLLAANGTVTIAPTGTTLNIIGLGTNFPETSPSYTVLTSTSGITGEFETVQDNLPDIDFVPDYSDPNALVLTYQNSTAESPKQVIGSALTSINGVATAYTQSINARSRSLGFQGFNRIGTSFEALGYVSEAQHAEPWMSHVVEPEVGPEEAVQGWGLWGALEGSDMGVDNTGAITGYDTTSFGLVSGVEYRGRVAEQFSEFPILFGIAAGLGQTD
ncbi:unnamed protein product, partial [Ectocarpus sp. 12 AP-2014]